MATLREFFDRDFSHALSANRLYTLHLSPDDGKVEVIARLHFDFDANAKYVSFFVSESHHPVELCNHLLGDLGLALSLSESAEIHGGFVGEEPAKSTELVFTGRVFFYVDEPITKPECEQLRIEAARQDIGLRIRDSSYSSERSKLEKPLAFLSHDTRDKDDVARPLARQLSRIMCPVWFDEYSLKVGDSLRESIEKGLKECKKCIVVLSPNFLSNSGWTKVEFNSVFTREIVQEGKFILPV